MQAVLGGHPTAFRQWDHGPRQALALHCSLAHAGAWSGLAAALPGVCLTAPDLPGHGRSADWDPETDLHATATRIAEVLTERIGAPLDLIGHSFGATVALRLALERPDLVRTLTLAEPVLFVIARGTPAFEVFVGGYADMERMAEGPRDAAAAFHGAWGVGAFDRLPESQQRYMIERMPLVRAQDDVLLHDAAGLTVPGRLERLRRPVLLVEGAQSPPVVAAIHDVLAARLPNARRLVVPGAGHMVPITHPGIVAAGIAALFASEQREEGVDIGLGGGPARDQAGALMAEGRGHVVEGGPPRA
jgi:pimeloyl-ACP methyl ester carboxylesterase